MGRVLQVNVGVPQRVRINGVDVDTVIVKQGVDHPVLLADDHAAGDVQADADNHGGPWHAVYASAGAWATPRSCPASSTTVAPARTCLRIVDPGEVRAGDTVEVVDRPDHGVTVVDVLRLWRGEREVAAHVLGAAPMLHPEVVARARAAT